MVVIDIETGPLPLEQLQATLGPYDPASAGKHPGEFDPESVKYGQTKDPDKRAAKLEECHQKHLQEVAAFERKQETAEVDHWKKILDRAALSAITGQVLAIGVLGKQVAILSREDRTEEEMLVAFWKTYSDFRKNGERKMVGFNLRGFDIPFLFQRSIILEVDVPEGVFEKDRYLGSGFIDLRDRWNACGNQEGSLNDICRACGIGAKPDDVHGKDFHRFFWNPETRQQAINYLINDLQMTRAFAIRMGINMPQIAEVQAVA